MGNLPLALWPHFYRMKLWLESNNLLHLFVLKKTPISSIKYQFLQFFIFVLLNNPNFCFTVLRYLFNLTFLGQYLHCKSWSILYFCMYSLHSLFWHSKYHCECSLWIKRVLSVLKIYEPNRDFQKCHVFYIWSILTFLNILWIINMHFKSSFLLETHEQK